MIITYLRSSSIGTYELCARQFLLRYITGFEDKGNKAAHKGSIIHKVLEALALVNLAKRNNQNFIDDGEVYQSLPLDLCQPDYLTELSYKYYTQVFSGFQWLETDLKDCLSWVNKAISYKDGVFDPRNLNIISPELHFDITIEKEWAKYDYTLKGEKISGYLGIKGTIDNVIDAGNNTIEILDWKSGKYRKNWATGKTKELEDFQHDTQLLLYVYAIYNKFPNIQSIIFTIYYINAGGPFTVAFDRSYIQIAEDMIREKFEKIKNDNEAQLTPNKDICSFLCKYGSKGKRIEGQSICNYIDREIQVYGIDNVIDKHLQAGFNPTKYGAGGGQQDRGNK